MSTLERLEHTLEQLRSRGYHIRQEWLGGEGSSACELRGRKLLFLDLAQSTEEQLDAAAAALGEATGRVNQSAA